MDIRKLQRAIVDGLEDVKAQNIAVFNTEHLSPLFERVIVASGTSNRQTKALASSVRETVKSRGLQVLRTEGEDNGEWIIVDCGAAVAHIMQPAIRDYYRLEEIWGGKAVKMKIIAPAPARAGRGAEAAPAPVVAKKAAPKRAGSTAPGAKRAGPTQPGARKVAAKKAGKTTARGASAPDKKVAARKAANRTAAFKRVAAKSPARKSGAGKATARRPGSGAKTRKG